MNAIQRHLRIRVVRSSLRETWRELETVVAMGMSDAAVESCHDELDRLETELVLLTG